MFQRSYNRMVSEHSSNPRQGTEQALLTESHEHSKKGEELKEGEISMSRDERDSKILWGGTTEENPEFRVVYYVDGNGKKRKKV